MIPQETSQFIPSYLSLYMRPFKSGHRPITALATAPIPEVAVTPTGFEAVATGAAVVVSGAIAKEAALVTPSLAITSPVGARLSV